MIRLRVSYNQNDETLSRNSLRYLSKANLPIAVISSCRAPLRRTHNVKAHLHRLDGISSCRAPFRRTHNVKAHLHRLDGVSIPERAEGDVGEAQNEQVHHKLLAKVVVLKQKRTNRKYIYIYI